MGSFTCCSYQSCFGVSSLRSKSLPSFSDQLVHLWSGGVLDCCCSRTHALVIEFSQIVSKKNEKTSSPRLQPDSNDLADLTANVRVCIECLAEGNANVYSEGMHGDDPVCIHHQAFCQESLHHSAECSAEVNSRLYWDLDAPARRDLDSRRRAGAQDLVAGGQYEVLRKGFDVNAYDIRVIQFNHKRQRKARA